MTLAVGMAACALFVSFANDTNQGQYSPLSLFLLTIGAILCLAAVVLLPGQAVEDFLARRFTVILAVIASLSTCVLFYETQNTPAIAYVSLFLAGLGLLQISNLRAWRIPLLIVVLVGFSIVSAITFASPGGKKYPYIDVFLFQQTAASALSHGQNPYAVRFPNIYSGNNSPMFQDPVRYGAGTPFYGTGVVDENGWLRYGFPYPPLSLLIVLPAYILGGDCRFACVIAMGLSALLMATARPGRWGALIALLFLVNPQGFNVIDNSWTEPLLVFTFSLSMFCACRWRKGLPWALGLFFATKQYTVFALPVLFLLVEGPNTVKQLLKMAAKAGLVVAATILPFFAWNPHEFIRAIVQWQLVQPFRTDALSYLVWIFRLTGGHRAPMWTPFLAIVPATLIAIWLCPRSPAGFAAAIALIFLALFAFNKQAFCNYYYFVIGTACWSAAAIWQQPKVDPCSHFEESLSEAQHLSPL